MKRFYKQAQINAAPNGDGYEIRLDGKALRHLATKAPFVARTKALAQSVADEWNAAPDSFEYKNLPVTCFLMGTASLTAEQKAGIYDKVFECACCDTLCCFVDTPQELRDMQNEKWLPVILKINEAGGAFNPSDSLCGRELSAQNRDFLQNALDALSNDALGCVQQLSAIFSSALLALAVLKGIVDARTAFDLSVLEETYQNMYWHEDAEAARAREQKREAAIFYAKILCKTGEMK